MDTDWQLTPEQLEFMKAHNNEIEDAYFKEDMRSLDGLVESGDYRQVFGDMSFDEAYDRYEGMAMNDPVLGFWKGMQDIAHGRVKPYVTPRNDDTASPAADG